VRSSRSTLCKVRSSRVENKRSLTHRGGRDDKHTRDRLSLLLTESDKIILINPRNLRLLLKNNNKYDNKYEKKTRRFQSRVHKKLMSQRRERKMGTIRERHEANKYYALLLLCLFISIHERWPRITLREFIKPNGAKGGG